MRSAHAKKLARGKIPSRLELPGLNFVPHVELSILLLLPLKHAKEALEVYIQEVNCEISMTRHSPPSICPEIAEILCVQPVFSVDH